MLFLVFVALLVAFLAVLYLSKRLSVSASFNSSLFEFGFFRRATLVIAGVLGMAGSTAGGGLPVDPPVLASLRLVTLEETPPAYQQKYLADKHLGLTAAGHRAKSNSILARRHDLAELREQIRYELRLGNLTAEIAATLSGLIDDINSENVSDDANAPGRQVTAGFKARQEALAGLVQSQARLNQALADTIKLVEVLGSVRGPEFSGTLVAAKIQVVKLLAEKAAVDGSIDEIRKKLKLPKAG
jgi:hypothetical protein